MLLCTSLALVVTGLRMLWLRHEFETTGTFLIFHCCISSCCLTSLCWWGTVCGCREPERSRKSEIHRLNQSGVSPRRRTAFTELKSW